MIILTKQRLPCSAQAERYRRQRQWLIDLEHLLDPEREPPKTSASVTQAVDRYLAERQYPAKPPLPHTLGRDGMGTVVVWRVSGRTSGVGAFKVFSSHDMSTA